MILFDKNQTNAEKLFSDRKVAPRYLPNKDFTRITEEEMQFLMDYLETKATEITSKAQ